MPPPATPLGAVRLCFRRDASAAFHFHDDSARARNDDTSVRADKAVEPNDGLTALCVSSALSLSCRCASLLLVSSHTAARAGPTVHEWEDATDATNSSDGCRCSHLLK